MIEETIARIKDLSLRDYIGDVPKNNKVICPKCISGLKENRTPALHIYKNNGYCFSCNTSFNIVNYVQYKEGLSFPKALSFLTNMYNISTEIMGRTWHVGNKTFYSEAKADEYRKEVELKEAIRIEISGRYMLNRLIDMAMEKNKIKLARILSKIYVLAIIEFNDKYGRVI